MARMGLAGAAGRWWGLALGLTAFFLPGAHTQVVQVNDSMYGFIGTDVVLHCSFANPLPGVKITQVTWQKATNGSKQNVASNQQDRNRSLLSQSSSSGWRV